MSQSLNRALIGAATLAACLGGIWLGCSFADNPPSPPPPHGDRPDLHAGKFRLPQPAPATANRPAPAAADAEPIGAAMLAKYKAAPNYRAFIYEAMKDPEHGGHEYSNYVLSVCGRANAEPKGAVSEAQREARAVIRARCDMSDSERRQMEDDLFRARTKEPGKDPIFKTPGDALLAGSPAERRTLLAQAMEFQYPSPALLLSAVPTDAGKGPYFRGKYYGTDSSNQFYLALNLAGCSLGVDCSAGSTESLTQCATRGWCGADRPAAMRAARPDDFTQIQALSAQIVQAIKRRDAAAFVPGV